MFRDSKSTDYTEAYPHGERTVEEVTEICGIGVKPQSMMLTRARQRIDSQRATMNYNG